MLIVLFLGFSAGLPLALSGSTLLVWMTEAKVDLGTIGLFDLRLLGMARELPPAAFDRLVRWGIGGFLVCLVTGALFFAGIPGGYIDNPAFRAKLLLLTLAGTNLLLFTRTVAHRVAGLRPGESAPLLARWLAGLSLLLWVAVLCAGRMIAFYKP